MNDCIFCKIVKGEIPSKKIYDDENSIAFLDLYPAAKGHSLVIPKNHHATILDIPEMELEELIKSVQKVSAAVMKATNADGFNLVQNNKEASGQVIHHLHFHIVPRKKDDGLKLTFGGKEAEPKELEEWEGKIKEQL